MNPICAIRRLACILAGLAVAFAATAPAALATPRPTPPGWNKHPPLPASTHPAVQYPPGWNKHPPLPAHVHTLATGGMPGWQITLIAAATVLAAAVVVLAARARAARRRAAASPA
jgi:ABC-type phosphate transport system permease subunit